MDRGFTATVTTRDPHTVEIRLSGELTFENAEDLDTLIIHQFVEHPRLRDLILDCAGIAAIDSIGLSILLMVKRRAEHTNTRLHLDNRPPRLERMLALTGTQAHFTAENA